ncbi:MAG: mycoredoxin [Actinomycetales bacterium]|nr:mycoredoxin [Actinomycetales bacterium]
MRGTLALATMKMYTTVWCGYCQRLKAQLGREGIAFEEIDIEADPAAAAFVESVNGGNQTVPTVLFDDGSALTNPSLGDVKAKLGVS